jgi:tetratricopeptide (TPR) repeat protein
MNKLLVVTMVILLCLGVQFAAAEDDLFDTKAAAEYLEKGLAQLRTKNVEEAISALEESVAIAPQAEAYYYLGYAYYLKGRSGDGESRKLSIESFEKAYDLEPGFTPTRFKPAEAMPPSASPELKKEDTEAQTAPAATDAKEEPASTEVAQDRKP